MKKLVVSLSAVLLLAGAGQAQFFDNFNSTTTVLGTTTLAGWTVTGGNIDILGSSPSALFNFYPGNGNFIELDGTSSGGSSTITSNAFTLDANTNYTLSFNLGKQGNATENVVVSILNSSFGGATITDSIAYPTFTTVTYNFTQGAVGTANAQIRFASTGNDNQGYIIDNVRVSGAPEPTTVALLGLVGLPFLGMIRRRK